MELDLSIFDEITSDDEVGVMHFKTSGISLDKVEEPKKKERKKKEKIRTFNSNSKKVKLSVIANEISYMSEVMSFEVESVKVSFKDSWLEMYGFLIGTIHNKHKEDFINIIANSGIFNNNLSLYSDNTKLDRYNPRLYVIPDTPYIIEVKNTDDIVTPIINAFKVLGIKASEVNLTLNKKGMSNKTKPKTKKISLAELLNGVDPLFQAHAVIVDGETIEITNLRHGILVLLAYLNITQPNIDELLLKYTESEVIGVTEDISLYLGYINKTKIPCLRFVISIVSPSTITACA